MRPPRVFAGSVRFQKVGRPILAADIGRGAAIQLPAFETRSQTLGK